MMETIYIPFNFKIFMTTVSYASAVFLFYFIGNGNKELIDNSSNVLIAVLVFVLFTVFFWGSHLI